MSKSNRYSLEFRERAVRLVFEHQAEHDSQWAAMNSMAGKVGCTAERLAAALAARPGRIDEAIEFPLPYQPGREKLIRLYAGELELSPDIVTSIAKRAGGVSGAFIKERMRRASQYYLDDQDCEAQGIRHIDDALQEMLFSGGRLNVKLLGRNE